MTVELTGDVKFAGFCEDKNTFYDTHDWKCFSRAPGTTGVTGLGCRAGAACGVGSYNAYIPTMV